MKVNKAKVNLVPDASLLCKDVKRFVIIPKRQTLTVAYQLCEVMSGKIVTPYTTAENEEVISIVKKHKKQCTEGKETDKKIWGS